MTDAGNEFQTDVSLSRCEQTVGWAVA